MTPEQRNAKEIKKSLQQLTQAVEKAITALDQEMKLPPSLERGQRIAKITNFLESNNTIAKISLK